MSNRDAFLTMIAMSEGTAQIGSENGYNVLVGSTAQHPLFFYSYADHPRVYNQRLNSTAAGRYQDLAHIFDSYKVSLNLPDFGPASQDALALQMIKECHALDDIDSGDIDSAILKCSSRWASLPGNKDGQHQNKIEALKTFFTDAGGNLMQGVTDDAAVT